MSKYPPLIFKPGKLWTAGELKPTAIPMFNNLYVDLQGQLRPRHFPKSGLWRYDGQFFYLPKEPVAV